MSSLEDSGGRASAMIVDGHNDLVVHGSRSYSAPLPAPIPEDEAMRIGEELYETFRSLPVRLATSPHDFGPERVAAVLHLEGAEPLAPDLSNLDS